MIVLPDGVVANWWRADGHRLVLDDLKDVRQDLPGIWSSVPARTGECARILRRSNYLNAKVKVEALPTADAARRY